FQVRNRTASKLLSTAPASSASTAASAIPAAQLTASSDSDHALLSLLKNIPCAVASLTFPAMVSNSPLVSAVWAGNAVIGWSSSTSDQFTLPSLSERHRAPITT